MTTSFHRTEVKTGYLMIDGVDWTWHEFDLPQLLRKTITDEKDKTYSIDDFSEGEQQLIVLDAIKKVICADNSVLFLDEPDAYLHPQRQREIIPYLKVNRRTPYPCILNWHYFCQHRVLQVALNW